MFGLDLGVVSGVDTKLVIDPEKIEISIDFTMKSPIRKNWVPRYFGINSLLLAYLGGDPPATFFSARPCRMCARSGASRAKKP